MLIIQERIQLLWYYSLLDEKKTWLILCMSWESTSISPQKNPKYSAIVERDFCCMKNVFFIFFYRDSFGENEEGGLLSLQDQPGLPSASTAASDRPSSSSTLVATPPSSSSTSSVILQTTRDHTSAYVSSQTRRKNYIIFEQNDEDTLI